MPTCSGFEIVCPDGNVRHYPFHHEDDAKAMANAATRNKKAQDHDKRPGCSPWSEPSDLELRHPPCAGGHHTVRPTGFIHSNKEKGKAN